ncbi:phosphoglycerate dehydrogenase-like oxidoreductase [Thermoplasmatales archaeon SCGC AB-539-N05]|nr:phosphoglycerate dehydrogenase-like oxidoreductase [Thermoplasmatales archaeon SCGC AB-539-N05]
MKVLITDKMAEEAIELFKDAGHEVTYNEMDPATLLKEIPKYDALMVRSRTRAIKEVVEAGAKGNLKVIGRAGIGVDNIDIETAAKNGIKVVNSPTGSTKSVAELAIGQMIALTRFIPKADSTMKKGEWIKKQLKGTELNGKTLGLIGSAYIAQHVAKIANCIGMNVLVYSPHCTDEKASKMGAKRKDLKDLLKESDFVSLHIPHNKDSHYILNKKTIGIMKPGSYIINSARGGVVEENALYTALKDGKLAGAAVDVFEQEPPEKDNKLLALDNVIATPHIGASTKEAQIGAGTVCAEQMLMVLDGKEPDFCVNKHLM